MDDDPKLRAALLMNVRVLGTGRDAANIVDRHNKRKRSRKIEEIVIAMPSASGRQMGEACGELPSRRASPARQFPVSESF